MSKGTKAHRRLGDSQALVWLREGKSTGPWGQRREEERGGGGQTTSSPGFMLSTLNWTLCRSVLPKMC